MQQHVCSELVSEQVTVEDLLLGQVRIRGKSIVRAIQYVLTGQNRMCRTLKVALLNCLADKTTK